ncbi:hypothetical protein [Duganella fentianensis]|uniref:hypothetical protein n=1 Tax=Duganella fentianensis TaxID=2692177 RepID=UPI0032B17A63
MTTNVFDVTTGQLTSDGRWSIEKMDWLVFVDDTGYDKIIFDDDLAFAFAGNVTKINFWKEWVAGGRVDPVPMDKLDQMQLIIVNMVTGALEFASDYILFSHAGNALEALYGGSGGPSAKDCWNSNRCAITAIESAKSKDVFSGGQTKFLLSKTKQNNLSNNVGVTEINEQCKQRGLMMNLKNPLNTVLVKEAANDGSNPIVQSIANDVMQGKAEMSAPFPGMHLPWTQEKKSELSSVLARFARKQ